MTPLIGIVTVLFNSDSVLPGFFESLSQQRGIRYKLYVIDNSPKDSGTAICRSMATRYGIDADIIFNNENRGVAAGNNQGITAALADHCDLILLCNNDVEFGPTTIAQLQSVVITENERIAVPKILYYGAPDMLWYAGGHFNLWKGTTAHDDGDSIDDGRHDEQRYVQYAPTCFMLIHADVFQSVSLMDEEYFVYYDDADFAMRLFRMDFRILYVPSARVLHKVSSLTGGSKSDFVVYYMNRNKIYFIRKHLPKILQIIAVGYTLATRIVRTCIIPARLSQVMWRGIWDGFRIPVGGSYKTGR